jgi:hypothetical protein
MFKKFVVSIAAILLLSSASLASIGQAQGCTVAASSWMANAGSVGSGAGCSMTTIAHCQMASSYCGMIAFQHQTCTVGLQTQMSWCFYWPPCPPPCPPYPRPCPPPPPPCTPSCVARGGDASATATAVSDGGSAYASARAVGGDAIAVVK